MMRRTHLPAFALGTVTPGANRVNGSFQGVDTYSVEVPVPVNVRVTWDITFK
jgi:hypothetical protein